MKGLVACCLLLVAGVAGSTASANDGADPAWFPLRAGAEWAYEVHRDLTYQPADASITRIFHSGRAVRTALAAPDRAPHGFLVRETTRLTPTSDRGQAESLSEWTLFSFDRVLRIHAAGETRADGQVGEVVYDKPLVILPTTTVGAKWNAGMFRSGGISGALEGEVVGIEDLSGTPAWPGSLEVRLRGNVAGTVPGADGPSEIESGRFERTLWFVRGVGVVREVTTITSEMKLPEDRRARTVQVLTLRLLDHRGTE